MVYSIVRHLWKLSKSKKFLPLPPLHKSLLAPFDIQGPLLDSASEEEGESSPRVSSVPESVSTNHHCNFGEINCFTVSENSESITSKNDVQLDPESKVKEFVKISINKSWSSSSISDISFATIAILKKDFSESMDLVQDSRRDYFSITMKNHSTSSFANHNLEGIVLIDLDFISLHMCSLLHHGNNTVLAVETVFDPGGVTDLPLNATVLDYYGEILRRELRFHNNGKTDLMITVFDPGGVIESFSVAMLGCTITLPPSLLSIFRLVIVLAIAFAGEFAVTVFDPGRTRLMSLMRSISLLLLQSLQTHDGMLQEREAVNSFSVLALDRFLSLLRKFRIIF